MGIFIVPIDGSDNSLKALAYATRLATPLQNDLLIVNVQPNLSNAYVKRFVTDRQIKEFREAMTTEAFEKVDDVIKDFPGTAEKQMLIGLPEKEICHVAEKVDAENIIMGTRGLSLMKGKILGSVSYSVLHEAPCPVTIVPSVD
ncbi:universal stress protein [Salinibacillus xinjiangensis]|uniref:Universal stress protein n=1 Tax=Salinibacillus xinjiangensis TaxID=1229268 RepID=A0A6G1X5M9_9BACI|nr:universal stress protein [Salinibacillus xinjiangensis]MRG86274.1 universal stress protein [Salinibacillus xinjiangensis]